MPTQPDTRNIVSRIALDRIAPDATPGTPTELNDILGSVNAGLKPLLEMRESSTPDQILNLGSIQIQDPNISVNSTIPPISNQLPTFASGIITFPSASGGSAVPSTGTSKVITISNDSFLKVGVSLDATGALVLEVGVEGATEALATVPPTVPSTYSIGFVVLETVGAVIQTVTNSRIFQYIGGGTGSSGTGDASSVITRLWDKFSDSIYEELAAIAFSSDTDTHVDGSSTGAYSLISGTYELDAASETFVSTNLLSADFLAGGVDLPKADLAAIWGDGTAVDENATYELSRDSGFTYTTVPMDRVGTTGAYDGTLDFPAPNVILEQQLLTSGKGDLDAGSFQGFSQPFTLAESTLVQEIGVNLTKTGLPGGNIQIEIHTDVAGSPGALITQVVSLQAVNINNGIRTYTTNEVLAAGTYHVVILGDATYQSSFVANTTEIGVGIDGAASGARSFGGAVWSATGVGMYFTAEGRATPAVTIDQTVSGSVLIINTSSQQKMSREFVLSETHLIDVVEFNVVKAGLPLGNMSAEIYSDNAGIPDTLLAVSTTAALTDVTSPILSFNISAALPAGTYHLALSGDDAYRISTAVPDGNLGVDAQNALAGSNRFDGSTWSAATGAISTTVRGRVLDLRARITASVDANSNTKQLQGLGVYYSVQPNIAGGVKLTNRFQFLSDTDNTSTFNLGWVADPDLLEVYHIEDGLVYHYPAFVISGTQVVFPGNKFFSTPDKTVTLFAKQTDGTSFDNTDQNAANITVLDARISANDTDILDLETNLLEVPLSASSGPVLATTSTAGAVVPKDMPGTNTNDNASAGGIGEVIQHIITSGDVNLGTVTGPLIILNSSELLTLTAGDWDVIITGQISIRVPTSPVSGGVDLRLYFKTVGGVFLDDFRTKAGIARALQPFMDVQFTMHGRVSINTTTSYEVAAQMGQISTTIGITSASSNQSSSFPLVITARRVR